MQRKKLQMEFLFFVVQLYKELPPAAPYGKNNIEGDEANERIDS